jgi:hypothetical protein
MRKTYMYNGGRCSKKTILERVSKEDFEAFEKKAEQHMDETNERWFGGMIEATLKNGEKHKFYMEIRR